MNRRESDQTLSEHELVARCKRGDRHAQRALYERTSGRVFGWLLRMTRSSETAEDLAQETYLKAFSAIAAFDGRSALGTWLYRIAMNEALQWLRRRQPAALDPQIVAVRVDPRSNGHDASTRIDLEAALSALDAMDRAMLLLRYQEGLDYRAIAEVANVAIGTVASRLNRARRRLRELLGDFAPEREGIRPERHPIQDGAGSPARSGAPLPGPAHGGAAKS